MNRAALRTRVPTALGALLLVAVASTGVARAESGDSPSTDATPAEIIVDLRVWQSVLDGDSLYLSARTAGGDWRAFGTVPLTLEHLESAARYRYGDAAVAGVTLRFWQSREEPGRIFLRPCSVACPPESARWRARLWRPLGMLALPLDDGHSTSGRYRYGNLTVAVPAASPGLQADREYLLALKDGLEGAYGPDLNWRAATAIARWEGITVGGVPPRVTKLQLSDRGLRGEMWGWLGNLTELRELRLDGNQLHGRIPSKLGQLSNLTHLYLRGNSVTSCLPPPLRTVPHHDIAEWGGVSPDCALTVLSNLQVSPPQLVVGSPGETGGTYQYGLIFDVPQSTGWRVTDFIVPLVDLAPDVPFSPSRVFGGLLFTTLVTGLCPESWVLLDPSTGEEAERHAANAFDEALLDQLVASVWIPEYPDRGSWIWQ